MPHSRRRASAPSMLPILKIHVWSSQKHSFYPPPKYSRFSASFAAVDTLSSLANENNKAYLVKNSLFPIVNETWQSYFRKSRSK
jgi:hypothetical protein